MNMTAKRWMKSVKDEAANSTTKMPWERGLRRQAMIARRLETDDRRAKITLAPMPDFMTMDMPA
jgi:nicotinamide mononucleotide adenylyltransferase